LHFLHYLRAVVENLSSVYMINPWLPPCIPLYPTYLSLTLDASLPGVTGLPSAAVKGLNARLFLRLPVPSFFLRILLPLPLLVRSAPFSGTLSKSGKCGVELRELCLECAESLRICDRRLAAFISFSACCRWCPCGCFSRSCCRR